MGVILGKHQLKAVEELANGKILCGGVGSGKSRTALAYYYMKVCDGNVEINGSGEFRKMTKPTDLYIITTAKKRDDLEWFEEALHFDLSRDPKSNINNVRITVDSWNNIKKYQAVSKAFFIFDEQRLVGSGAWVKAFIQIARHNQWILLSATPGDTWLDYIPVFVANGYYRNRTEFKHEHVVYRHGSTFPRVDHYVGEGRLLKIRRRILVEMPLERHTTRTLTWRFVDHDTEVFTDVYKRRWNPYEGRPVDNVGEFFSLMRRVVNSDPSRIAEIIKIYGLHKRLIIFYNFDYELELLRGLQSLLGVPVREWNGHKHEYIPDAESWVYLVQYLSGAEGWNCVSTNAMVFYSLNYSYRITEQAQGRTDRLNTPYTELYYYFLRSRSEIDRMIVKALVNKRNFNESDIKIKL